MHACLERRPDLTKLELLLICDNLKANMLSKERLKVDIMLTKLMLLHDCFIQEKERQRKNLQYNSLD